MDPINRRKALKILLSGAAAAFSTPIIQACQAQTTPPSTSTTLPGSTRASRTATATPFQPAAATETGAPTVESSPTSVVYPDLVVARTGEPEPLVRAAVDAIGGLQRFVPQGGWVIIKPNICTAYHSYDYAATTNPWVVGALVKMAFEAGASKVQVMDYPFGGTAADAYRTSGIEEQVIAAGGEMVQMPMFKFKSVNIENALSLSSVEIYEDLFQADVVIDVPIAKHHSGAGLTLAMKNLMGVITNREQIHWDLDKRIPDLVAKIRPHLTVIDAVRVLLANGPTGGNLNDVRKDDTIIVSTDIVAADSYATRLFGKQPNDLGYIRTAAEVGLGRSDLTALNIKELTVGG